MINRDGFNPEYAYVPRNYKYKARWVHLDSTITIDYFEGQEPVIRKSYYRYSNPLHKQPTEIVETLDGGAVMINRSKYPQDYTLNTFSEMIQQNRILNRIEEQQWLRDTQGSEKMIAGSLAEYIKNDYGDIVLDTEYQLQTDLAMSGIDEGKSSENGFNILLPVNSRGSQSIFLTTGTLTIIMDD